MRNSVLFVGAALSAFALSMPAKAAEEAKPVRTAALEAGSVEAPKAKDVAVVKAAPKAVKKAVKKRKKRAASRLVARINLSSQRMNVLVDGQVKHSWKISSGARGFHTPTGSYKPYYMTSMHYSRKYNNAPMPHSVFFRGGYAIHATSSLGRLGTPASHGCIRLHPSNARKFFKLVQRYKKAGTAVRISGVTPSYKPRRRVARASTRQNSAQRRAQRRSNSWSGFNNYSNSYTGQRKRMRTRRVSSSRIMHTWW